MAGHLEWLWGIHLCVYSCPVRSSFKMNGLGLRFYFLAKKIRYRTYNRRYRTYECAFPNDLAVGSY